MKAIIIIILSLIGLVVAFVLAIWTTGKIYDKLAFVNAKRYCENNKLDFVDVKPFPNHYGLYFRCEGKSFYASFDFGRDRTITWKKGTPLDRVQRKKGSNTQYKL